MRAAASDLGVHVSSSSVALTLVKDPDRNGRRVLAQCDRPGCGTPQVPEFWPYCSQSCGVKSFWAGVEAIEDCVDQLDMPLRAFHHLDVILDDCPFEEAGGKLQHVIRNVRAAISAAQRELAKSAVDFTHGTTAFTDALGPLISGCDDDVRQANPAWMKLPETWSVSRDTRWQRGAMAGDFIQHWLSYHLFGTTVGVILVVYRSTWLRDTDKMYKPVAEILADGCELLSRETRPDTDMMFGQGELTIYALKHRDN